MQKDICLVQLFIKLLVIHLRGDNETNLHRPGFEPGSLLFMSGTLTNYTTKAFEFGLGQIFSSSSILCLKEL